MTRYEVKLTEQEELSLKQLVIQVGFDVVFKFLQIESLNAQTEALQCKSLVAEERSTALMKAQVTADVVSNLTQRLAGYRHLDVQTTTEDTDPYDFSMFNQRSN